MPEGGLLTHGMGIAARLAGDLIRDFNDSWQTRRVS
jgi:hypothetical protein